MEKAARLFPIRTGVLVPDWLVIGNEADHIGASAVVGAGYVILRYYVNDSSRSCQRMGNGLELEQLYVLVRLARCTISV
jgi:hypothetical protein